jgi:hypothetical protein
MPNLPPICICGQIAIRYIQMDIAAVRDVVKRYAKRQDKDLGLLMSMRQCLRMFKVEKIIRSYLEVLP